MKTIEELSQMVELVDKEWPNAGAHGCFVAITTLLLAIVEELQEARLVKH